MLLQCLSGCAKQAQLLQDVQALRSRLCEPCCQDSMTDRLKAALASGPFSAASFLAKLGLQHFVAESSAGA